MINRGGSILVVPFVIEQMYERSNRLTPIFIFVFVVRIIALCLSRLDTDGQIEGQTAVPQL